MFRTRSRSLIGLEFNQEIQDQMKSFNNTVNIIKEIQLDLFDLFEGNDQFGFHFYVFKTDLENLTDIVSENLKRE